MCAERHANMQVVRNCKGRSINKLQNSVILLVFQILENRNIRFIENLIPSISCELYDDDVTVTSFINI